MGTIISQVVGQTGKCTVFLTTPPDLVRWTTPQQIRPSTPCASSGDYDGAEFYHSLVDPADTTVNFERSGLTPYLYFVRGNAAFRDWSLIRVRLRRSRSHRDGHRFKLVGPTKATPCGRQSPLGEWRMEGGTCLVRKKPPTRKTSVPHPIAAGQPASRLIDQRIRDLGDWRGQTLARMRTLILEADPMGLI